MPQDSAESTPMSFPARVVATFTAPARLFQELVSRPTWLAPLLTATLAIAALQTTVMWSKTGEAAMRQEFQEKLPANAPPGMVDQQMAVTKYAAPISVVIFIPIVTLILAGLVYLIFSIGLGGEGTYRQTFSCYSHVNLIGILGTLVGTVMIFLKGNMKSSTALSAFLPFLEESSFAYRFCQGLDLFVLWQLGVLAIGMAVVNKMTTRKSATVIYSVYLVIWLAITAVRQAWS